MQYGKIMNIMKVPGKMPNEVRLEKKLGYISQWKGNLL